jgi:hypothetical protein
VQIRTQDLLCDVVVSILAKALDAHRDDIERGSLLSIDEAGTGIASAGSISSIAQGPQIKSLPNRFGSALIQTIVLDPDRLRTRV